MADRVLREAERLRHLGFAIHWIKPESKAPVESGWSKPERDSWKVLRGKYRVGYGVGVKLGKASPVGGGYLANIDVDVKSGDKAHLREALTALVGAFGKEACTAPFVRTGYGRRYFVRTRAPAESRKIAASGERCKVLMPSAPVNRQQELAVKEGFLTAGELADGWRVRPAWEVEFMSEGRQVVLPPSVHPDTGKEYEWDLGLPWSGERLPLVSAPPLQRVKGAGTGAGTAGTVKPDFKALPSEPILARLPRGLALVVTDGDPNEADRSTAMYLAAMRMVRVGLTDQEILSVLTDRGLALGQVAYEHRQTESRRSAADWVRRYTLEKAKAEASAAVAFESAVIVEPTAKQRREQKSRGDDEAWKAELVCGGQSGEGPPKPTLQNTVLILSRAVGDGVFETDQFRMREQYGVDTPWGGRAGELVDDADAVKIRKWMADEYRVEPPTQTVFDAITWIGEQRAFHSGRRELEQLPEWDGVLRLDGWLKSHFGAVGPRDYLGQVFRKWLVASVKRTYEPGAKFDWLPIFEGHQGGGKSSFGSILFGEEFFSDWLPPLTDKDAALNLQGIRCHEFSELESLRRNEVETIKAFVTRRIDKVRPPYGRKVAEVPRGVVFFGSTNKDTYLRDDTGNRRFFPIKVGELDFTALRRDKEQLWAEALWIYQNGLEPTLYLEDKAKEHSTKIQASKMVQDRSAFMEEEISRFIEREKAEPTGFNFNRFKLVDLWHHGMAPPLQKYPDDTQHLMFAGKALRALGARTKLIRSKKFWDMQGALWVPPD